MSSSLLSIDSARATVLSVAGGRLGTEPSGLDAALGRTLAADLCAAGDVPPFASSAMDGFAVSGTPAAGPFEVVGESRAGLPYGRSLSAGQAVRISTGAAVPAGAVAVVKQEDVGLEDGRLELASAPAPGANVRNAGEDLEAGDVVLHDGTRLGPAELALAAAAGASELLVARRPDVLVLCTGDELQEPGRELGPGQIHNSNGPMLRALAIRSGASAPAPLRLPDDPEATERALAVALDSADLLLVSGGVSVGPHDHVKPALASLGVEQHFWGVALQPGKPTWFGSRERQLVFGLPGNPVSAAVTFALFAAPALAALLGAAPPRPPVAQARLAVDVRRNPGRDQAIRVLLESDAAEVRARPTGAQGSHLLTSLVAADALAIIPRGAGVLSAGTIVDLEALPR